MGILVNSIKARRPTIVPFSFLIIAAIASAVPPVAITSSTIRTLSFRFIMPKDYFSRHSLEDIVFYAGLSEECADISFDQENIHFKINWPQEKYDKEKTNIYKCLEPDNIFMWDIWR